MRLESVHISQSGIKVAHYATVMFLASLAVALCLFGVQAAQEKTEAFKVGLIPDVVGINDQSFNEMAYQGLLRAQQDFGIVRNIYSPTLPSEYDAKIQQCITDGNDLCIGVGFLLGPAIEQAAQTNPSTKFSIVDYSYESYPTNLRGINFAAEEASYLAGVLAARMTGSKVLGAIGGMPIQPVDRFIKGFRQGALCTDPAIKTLIEYTYDFGNPPLGEQFARGMLNQGADVVFGVAGPTGFGAVITTTHDSKWAIGVDTDYFYKVFEGGAAPGAQYLLTSVMKNVDNAVYSTISDLVTGNFTSGEKTYNLADGGVGLAPFHDADPAVSQSVRNELAAIKQAIIAGSIDPLSPCPGQPEVGLVSDTAGFNDNGFNWMAYQGLWRAQNELGVFIRTYESASGNDYLPNLQQCVLDGASLCFGTGFLMGDAVNDAALANPTKKFAILDYAYNSYPANLRGTNFAVDQASYLAGVLAAGMPGVDKVGAIGGMQIPPVDLFINGYRQGAQCKLPNTSVLVDYAGSFVDPQLGEQLARQMLNQGADAIFAVAGPTGTGAVITTTHSQKWAIGVDVDYYNSVFNGGNVPGAEYLLTSVMKRLDNAVYGTVADMKANNFTSGTKSYDLANQGVGLAPYHDAEPAVPAYLRSYLLQLEQDIIAGKINQNSPCRYYFFLPLVRR